MKLIWYQYKMTEYHSPKKYSQMDYLADFVWTITESQLVIDEECTQAICQICVDTISINISSLSANPIIYKKM